MLSLAKPKDKVIKPQILFFVSLFLQSCLLFFRGILYVHCTLLHTLSEQKAQVLGNHLPLGHAFFRMSMLNNTKCHIGAQSKT